MALRAALCLLPLAAFAQAQQVQAPPDVDQALRARVSEFFQDFVDSKFRDAMKLVAEDTQDEYLASAKSPIKSFEIRDVKYSADFAKADVTLQVKRVWAVPAIVISQLGAQGAQAEPPIVDIPMTTTWKIEKGMWVWTHDLKADAWLTPMGPSNVELIRRNADGTVSGIPQQITPQSAAAAAQKILQQTGVNKTVVSLAADKPSSDKVVFHNSAQGSIHLELSVTSFPGFTAKLDKTDLNFGEDAVIQVSYNPPTEGLGSQKALPVIRLSVTPFNQIHEIRVQIGASK